MYSCDFDYDNIYKRRPKRRRLNNNNNNNSGSLKMIGEEDYCIWGNDCVGKGNLGNNSEDEEEEDPHWKMFMENLRGDGKSFVLEVCDSRDGCLDFIKYEKPVDRDGDMFPIKVGERKCLDSGKRRDLVVRRGGSLERLEYVVAEAEERRSVMVKVEEEDIVEDSHRFLKKKRKNVMVVGEDVVEESNRFVKKKRKNVMAAGEDVVEESNRFVKKKRKNVMVAGKSNRVLEKKMRNVMVMGKDIVGKSNRVLEKKMKNVMVMGEDMVGKPNRVLEKKMKSVMVAGKDIVGNSNRVLEKNMRNVDQRRDAVDDLNVGTMNKGKKKYVDGDPCYKSFLKNYGVKGDSLFISHKSRRLIYGEEDERSSDLEILEPEDVLNHDNGNFSPFVVTDVFATLGEEDELASMGDENEHPPFRKALMGVLRRPYNKEEYKNLSRLVKFKPLKGDPEDSRGLKLKDSDIYGKSPLEYHPDVKKKLCAAGYNRPKRLNILRGFMYWYERSCQDGAFKPWLDKSCLAIRPSKLRH